MTLLKTALQRHHEFSQVNFGPGLRRNGLLNHILSEVKEVELAEDNLEAAEEWVDVIILAMDGLLRSLQHERPAARPKKIAALAALYIEMKMDKNEQRSWPDYLQFSQDQPIEHDRSGE